MSKEILLIDDDIDDLQLFCDALEAIDPSIRCRDFSGCTKALGFLIPGVRRLPICIFIDLSMPMMGGKECLGAIKADSLLKDVPAFIISGYITEEQQFELIGLGASGFVTKPDSFEKLKDEISGLLRGLGTASAGAA